MIFFAIFLILAQSFIILGHYILYKTLVVFFGITALIVLNLLRSVLLLLSVSFFLTSYVTIRHQSKLLRVLYIISAVWLGLFYFLFIASCLTVLVYISSIYMGIMLRQEFIAAVIYCIACATALYGIWNVFHPRITQKEVYIENLPTDWQHKRVVFFADTHFGNIYNVTSAKKLVDMIKSLSPNLLLIGGDFFDGPVTNFSHIAEPFRELVTSVPTYYVTGNHESYQPQLPYLDTLESIGVHILNNQTEIVDGVMLIGLDFLSSDSASKERKILSSLQIDHTMPIILLKHVPVQLDVAYEHGISLQLSGHTHRGQVWPFPLLTKQIYKGFDYGLHEYNPSSSFANLDKKCMQVLTTSGAFSWGPPFRVGTKNEVVSITFKNKIQ